MPLTVGELLLPSASDSRWRHGSLTRSAEPVRVLSVSTQCDSQARTDSVTLAAK